MTRTATHPFRPAHRLAVCMGLLAALADAAGSFRTDPTAAADLTHLKAEYLACEEAAARTALPPAVIAHCSQVYEALKARAFGGDPERLRAWWQAAREGGQRAGPPGRAD